MEPADRGSFPALPPSARGERSSRVALVVATGWVMLASIYAALLYAQSSGAMGALVSARVALATTLAPSLMGIAVWWWCGRLPMPEQRWVRFATLHLVAGAVFAATWGAWMLLVANASPGAHMPTAQLARSVLPWHAVMGLLLYCGIAGLAYAWREALRSRDLRLAAERAERLVVEADLAVLRAHINPHFLFNTLHSVSELLDTQPASARLALERLADLFRYTLRLDRQKVQLVSLEEEWLVTESFLWLERLRMGERLVINAELSDDALGCSVPPFTLQPIVENAIRHGLGPMASGGTLTIRAEEMDGRLVIDIQDDGVGTNAAAIEASRGMGLRSVRQRVRALSGADGTVTVASTAGAGTRVTIVLSAEIGP